VILGFVVVVPRFACMLLLLDVLIFYNLLSQEVDQAFVSFLHLFHDESEILILLYRLIFSDSIAPLELLVFKLGAIPCKILLVIKMIGVIFSLFKRLVGTNY